jgi:hypothetical protein
MCDIEVADKSTFPYGYDMPMMNILFKRFTLRV